MSEIQVKAIKPLPEPLPEGESVLWQHSPCWQGYSRRAFQIDKIALYFLIVVAWVAGSAYFDSGSMMAVLRALSWSLPPVLGVLIVLGFVAWLYAKTSVYTVTNKRVVIQSGLAFQTFVNLPYSNISSADLKTYKDGTGDIELTMSGPRLLYSMVWPNLKFLRMKRPVPVLRALAAPHKAADILGQALAADQPAETSKSQHAQAPSERDSDAEIRGTATP